MVCKTEMALLLQNSGTTVKVLDRCQVTINYQPHSYKLSSCNISHLIRVGGAGNLSTESVKELMKNLREKVVVRVAHLLLSLFGR